MPAAAAGPAALGGQLRPHRRLFHRLPPRLRPHALHLIPAEPPADTAPGSHERQPAGRSPGLRGPVRRVLRGAGARVRVVQVSHLHSLHAGLLRRSEYQLQEG